MPVGTCDPATRGQAFNVMELAAGGGQVIITVRYSWDGVSTRSTPPVGCDGPVKDVRIRNLSLISYWALLPSKKVGNPWFEMLPGSDQTFQGGQLGVVGLQTYSDCAGVTITDVSPV